MKKQEQMDLWIESIKSLQVSFQKLVAVILFVLVGFFCCVVGVTAQEFVFEKRVEEEKVADDMQRVEEDMRDMRPYRNYVGFTASLFSGVGLHYKRLVTPRNSVKLVLGGWQSSGESSTDGIITKKSENTLISMGLEYHFHILNAKKYTFYALAGGRTWYSEYMNPDDRSLEREINNINVAGVGLGTSFLCIGNHFVLNIECGPIFYSGLERQWKNQNSQAQFIRNYERKMTYSFGAGMNFIF